MRTVNRVRSRAPGRAVDHGGIGGQGIPAAANFSLSQVLVCDSCGTPLRPSWSTGLVRIYVALCGCRREPLDAAVVEQMVRNRLAQHSSALVAGLGAAALKPLVRNLFVEIRVGAVTDELTYVWRI